MTLQELRDEINRIDASIMDLLKARTAYVHQVGEIKKSSGTPVFVPERESAMLARLLELNAGALPEKGLRAIWRQIVSCSCMMEGGMRVGYLGPEGTWSHQAALNRFGECATLIPFPDFANIFSAVERGEADYGVIPIENSTDGSVSQAVDHFAHTELYICAQMEQPVQNCLMSNAAREDIKVIYSHPQVLGQCRNWLLKNFPKAAQVPTVSTTAAAQVAAEKAADGAAALGCPVAAEYTGLKVLERNIQDKATNATRFAVIGHQKTRPTGKDRTTICFTVPHVAGGLVEVLQHFKAHGINILSLDSRPTRDTPWEYLFYVVVEGHEGVSPLADCLAELRRQCPMFKVLGSYPES